jgi:epoxyqueuosine reductase QueG
MQQSTHRLLERRLDSSVYDYGFADLTGLLPENYAACTRGISIIRRLDDAVIDAIADGPTEAYLEHYNHVNAELNALVQSIAAEMSDGASIILPIKATLEEHELSETYTRTLTYDISHKMIATRSGLGWIGKTDLLVSRRFGPRVRLASILTDLPLEPLDAPIDQSRCGSCSLCVDICPAGAATGEPWKAGMHRDRFFDAFRCREYCRSISKQRLNRAISLCGKCVHICPGGRAQISEAGG